MGRVDSGSRESNREELSPESSIANFRMPRVGIFAASILALSLSASQRATAKNPMGPLPDDGAIAPPIPAVPRKILPAENRGIVTPSGIAKLSFPENWRSEEEDSLSIEAVPDSDTLSIAALPDSSAEKSQPRTLNFGVDDNQREVNTVNCWPNIVSRNELAHGTKLRFFLGTDNDRPIDIQIFDITGRQVFSSSQHFRQIDDGSFEAMIRSDRAVPAGLLLARIKTTAGDYLIAKVLVVH